MWRAPSRRRHRCDIASTEDTRRHFDLAGPYLPDTPVKIGEHRCLGGPVCEEMYGVDRPQLAEAVDSADALFEPNRIPRKLEIDDKAASRLKVESLGARIRCQQQIGDAGIERVNSGSSFHGRQPTMQQCDAPKRPQCFFEHGERVSILGKHHRRFRYATKQANERAHFAFVVSGSFGDVEDGSERILLLLDTIEGRSREQGRRVGSTFVFLETIERQSGLNRGGVVAGETREPSVDRHGK